jgi:hypothetical protein
VTMVHRGFPTTELRDEHRVGLPNAFTQLARVVSAGLQKPKAKCCVSGARRCRSGR